MVEVCDHRMGLLVQLGWTHQQPSLFFILARIPLLALPGDKTQEFVLRLFLFRPKCQRSSKYGEEALEG